MAVGFQKIIRQKIFHATSRMWLRRESRDDGLCVGNG
jgi:hypothetical protein